MGQGPGSQAGAAEALLQGYSGDDTLIAMITKLVADLTDDLADMDQEQALLIRTGAAGDSGGEKFD
ncbi:MULTISPECIES: hypothetical protein [Streptomyces]|uniref:hypothetical protein n=1 Tax=Streptomyces TaxID=1883 RepID=UPI0004C8CF23|nr:MULTISPECIES: hypothetical protein [Streptomyces]KUJ64748.1 hypothetical protein ACZ90_56595 [Streptomyces albus subsp. albus]MDX2918245.1 hypothetical protein [Streptomyces sp. NE06-03C]MDX3608967.1 hypothetical protein [Streptomyces sp. FL06-04B]MDX3740020.1 hypothetical protein [Streptomyces sp. ID01-15D]